MKEQAFWEALKEYLEIPFDYDDVDLIESDASGTVYIDLKDGTSFYITVEEADPL